MQGQAEGAAIRIHGPLTALRHPPCVCAGLHRCTAPAAWRSCWAPRRASTTSEEGCAVRENASLRCKSLVG